MNVNDSNMNQNYTQIDQHDSNMGKSDVLACVSTPFLDKNEPLWEPKGFLSKALAGLGCTLNTPGAKSHPRSADSQSVYR